MAHERAIVKVLLTIARGGRRGWGMELRSIREWVSEWTFTARSVAFFVVVLLIFRPGDGEYAQPTWPRVGMLLAVAWLGWMCAGKSFAKSATPMVTSTCRARCERAMKYDPKDPPAPPEPVGAPAQDRPEPVDGSTSSTGDARVLVAESEAPIVELEREIAKCATRAFNIVETKQIEASRDLLRNVVHEISRILYEAGGPSALHVGLPQAVAALVARRDAAIAKLTEARADGRREGLEEAEQICIRVMTARWAFEDRPPAHPPKAVNLAAVCVDNIHAIIASPPQEDSGARCAMCGASRHPDNRLLEAYLALLAAGERIGIAARVSLAHGIAVLTAERDVAVSELAAARSAR